MSAKKNLLWVGTKKLVNQSAFINYKILFVGMKCVGMKTTTTALQPKPRTPGELL